MIISSSIGPVKTVAMILAGGVGSRLSALSAKRAKPAVPFGGIYRIIDFTLSNVTRSNVPVVGVCTQYKPYSLMDHISVGEAWGFARRGYVCKILPPYTGEEDSDWYAGTGDAIHQNLGFIERYQPKTVLILSGDHIYHMDYRSLLAAHAEREAVLTIACQEVPFEEAHRFGVILTNEEDRVVGFQEKPAEPQSNLANLGIYVFDAKVLFDRLRADARDKSSTHDFGRDIIPRMVADGAPCYVSRFSGYWRDVGTVKSYWDAHMDILDPESGLDLERWTVSTAGKNLGLGCMAPAKVREDGAIRHSVVSWGCRIEGRVSHSVLAPGVEIGPGSVVEDSVLLSGVRIGSNCTIRRAVLDKIAQVGSGARVGVAPRGDGEEETPAITLIGKGAEIPPEYIVYEGTTIPYGTQADGLPSSPIGPSDKSGVGAPA